jgi:hypothetical protein
MTIPFDLAKPWSGSVISSEPDTGVEIMAHIALTSLCEDCLTAHFHTKITSLARYTQYLFNLQHSTVRTGTQRRTSLIAYKKSATTAVCEIERLWLENDILCNSAHPPSEQDHELNEVYHCLGNAEHGWNHTRMLLDITREEVETHTHGIIHLQHHVEVQDARLEERVEMIANLEQQLLELQVQAPPEPTDPEEIDVMSGIDED